MLSPIRRVYPIGKQPAGVRVPEGVELPVPHPGSLQQRLPVLPDEVRFADVAPATGGEHRTRTATVQVVTEGIDCEPGQPDHTHTGGRLRRVNLETAFALVE